MINTIVCYSKNMTHAKVTSRFQVAIPKEIRDRLKLKIGDYIMFGIEGKRVYIVKGKMVEDK